MSTLHDFKYFSLKTNDLIFFLISNSIIFIYFTSYAYFPNIFNAFIEEDSLGEWSQCILYFASSILSFILLIKNFPNPIPPLHHTQTQTSHLNKIIFLVLGISLLFIALEEINYGQRVFKFHIGFIEKHNFQRESNIHNLLPLQGNTQLYLAFSLACSLFIPFFDYFLSRKRQYSPLFCDLFFIGTHLELFILYVLLSFIRGRFVTFFYEFSETLIALSFFKLLLLRVFEEKQKKNHAKKTR